MNSSNFISKNSKVAIIIPAYKSVMSEYELISYRQCLKVLCNFDTFIMSPENLDISEYTKWGNVNHYKQDSKFFSSIFMYNKLMLDPKFYKDFEEYQYVLIYQLDCYVFRDELELWCDMGFDYIGAPWVGQDLVQWVTKKRRNYPFDLKFIHRITNYKMLGQVGNGGFSLRKTTSMIRNLKFFSLRTKYYGGNEDIFFAHYLGAVNPFFRIPDLKTALRFGFDANPHLAFEMNGRQLPFGCHGWCRKDQVTYNNNREFWKEHII